MKKNLNRAAALLLVIAASTGCVNDDYDLRTLDPTVTILPGLKIHVNQDQDKNVLKDQTYLIRNDAVKQLSDNHLAISGDKNSPKNSKSSYKGGNEIRFETPLAISTASWVEGLLPGAIIDAPLVPVVAVTNPTDIAFDLYGTAKCGEKSVEFGPCPVDGGTTLVRLEDAAIRGFFQPICYDIEISDLRLVCSSSDVVPDDAEDFIMEAYAPLTFNPGDRLFIEYPCSTDFLSSIDLKEKAEKYHISVESLSVNLDIINSFPFDINISASGELDNGPASASISPWISAGSSEAPVKSSVVVKANLPKGALSFKNATICVEGKVTGREPASITAEQNFSYNIVDITLDSGITLGK